MEQLWKKFDWLCGKIADVFIFLFGIAFLLFMIWIGYWARKEMVKDAVREVQQENIK